MLEEILKTGGPTAVTIVGLIIIVKLFLKYNEKRDEEFNKIVTNHITHSTEETTKLNEKTEEHIKATKENTRVLQGVKEVLIKFNGKK